MHNVEQAHGVCEPHPAEPFVSGPIALVTGAGSGVGRATALTLCANGYTVYLSGRRAAALQETVERAQSPDRAIAVPSGT